MKDTAAALGVWGRARRMLPTPRRLAKLPRRARAVLFRLRPTRTWANPVAIAQRSLRQAVADQAAHLQGRLLDVGCGVQPYRGLFNHVERYVGLDGRTDKHVDVCGDGLALPFRDAVFDAVLCNQVLEHVPEPAALVAEVARVLKSGGVLLLTAPQTWGLHLEPNDYYRYTVYGLRHLAEKSGLDVVEISPTCGLWATVAQRIVDTAMHTYAVRWPRWGVEALAILLAPVLRIGWLIDRLAGKRGDTLDYVMLARKA